MVISNPDCPWICSGRGSLIGRPTCDCSCRWLIVAGIALLCLSIWVALIAYREKRRWLFTWSCVYATTAFLMTIVTKATGPDPHAWFGCSVPLSLWVGCLFVATLSYYTTDYMRRDQVNQERPERYVFDPKVGEYVLAQQVNEYHVV